MNLLDFEQNKKARNFVSVMFSQSMIPIINKPTCVTKETATAIDNNYKIGYFGSFSNILLGWQSTHIKDRKERWIFRRNLFDISVEKFKYKLHTVSSGVATYSSDKSIAYDNFIEILAHSMTSAYQKKEN